MILTKREKEFIQDWLKVVRGEMEKIEFFRKWATKKDDANFLDDYEAVEKGEMSVEEFREKWVRKGDWKKYITVMRCRLRKKHKNLKRMLKELREEVVLLNEFFSLEVLP